MTNILRNFFSPHQNRQVRENSDKSKKHPASTSLNPLAPSSTGVEKREPISQPRTLRERMQILQHTSFKSIGQAQWVSSETLQDLIGQTLTPNAAYKLRKQFDFDGTGQIIGFKNNKISLAKHQLALNNVTPPLHRQPQRRGHISRTPGETLIDIAARLQKETLPAEIKGMMASNFKYAFMSGDFSRLQVDPGSEGIAKDKLTKIITKTLTLLPNGYEAMRRDIDAIMQSMQYTVTPPKFAENYYGRIFDTELAKYIANSSAPALTQCKNALTNFIQNDFVSYNESQQQDICDMFYDRGRADPTAWKKTIAEYETFTAQPNPENYLLMLNSEHQFAKLLVMSIGAEYLYAAPHFNRLERQAMDIYNEHIVPQRSTLQAPTHDIMSNRTGIMLPHQHYKYSDENKVDAMGERPLDRLKFDSDLTLYNQKALRNEKPSIVGISGTSNLLNKLFSVVGKNVFDFSIEHAQLMASSYLTFSGGHSFNEAYSVFKVQKLLASDGPKTQFSNEELYEPVSWAILGGLSQEHRQGLDTAWDRMLEASGELQEKVARSTD